jgi:hypothetical protein
MSVIRTKRGCKNYRTCIHLPPLTVGQTREILDRMVVDDSDQCWTWRYLRRPTTYTIDGHLAAPYRWVWAVATGEDICSRVRLVHHKCLNRWCVNPAHLQSMTYSEHGRLHYELRQAA